MTAAIRLGLCVLAIGGGCMQEEQPEEQCREISGPPLPAETSSGTLQLGAFDWEAQIFVPFEPTSEIWLTEGAQDGGTCMLVPSMCVEADWVPAEPFCMRVSWVNEVVEGSEGEFDAAPTVREVFELVDTAEGPRMCGLGVRNVVDSCGLGGALLRMTADVQDARDNHARATVEVRVRSEYEEPEEYEEY